MFGVDEFVRDKCVIGTNQYATKSQLFTAYCDYCERQGFQSLVWKSFKAELLGRGLLESSAPVSKRWHVQSVFATPVRAFKGLSLR